VSVKNKTVFVRADLNCPVENGVPQKSPRLVEHAKTIFELCKNGAKVVILAHQGREGKSDFISLNAHTNLLSAELSNLGAVNLVVHFCPHVCGKQAISAIKNLNSGQVLVLENTRFVKSETQFEKTKKSEIVDDLSSLCDIFVLDAFSVAHRAHASVVGFSNAKCVAGRVMQKELEALSNLDCAKHPNVLILGGAKPSDSLPILKNWLESKRADFVLCGGAMGNLMLLASGKSLGSPSEDFLQKSGSCENIAQLTQFYELYKDKLILPIDVVVDSGSGAQVCSVLDLPTRYAILDIGPKTIQQFVYKIDSAGSIIMNGPMGVYEKDAFSQGTSSILKSIANSKAFSLLGGGHTLSALEKFAIGHSNFGYVSLSGKALVEYLSGETLPGIELLRKSAKKKSSPLNVIH